MRAASADDHRLEDDEAVGRAHQRIGGAFGVRHHAEHVALAVEDAGDVAQRAVRVVDIAEGDAVLGFEFVERALVGVVAALAVGDREVQDLAAVEAAEVNGESVVSTRSGRGLQMNFRPALRTSAPGSRPASTRIWKPLQMPAPARHRRRTPSPPA